MFTSKLKSHSVLVLCWAASASVAAANTSMPQLGSSSWFSYCSDLKGYYQSDPAYDRQFSQDELAAGDLVEVGGEFWAIRIGDSKVPIEKRAYSRYKFDSREYGVDVRLLSTGGVKVYLAASHASRYVDVIGSTFSRSSWPGPEYSSSMSNKRLTSKFFGGPVSRTELMVLAFAEGPKDIQCSEQSAENDLRLLVLMQQKSVAPDFSAADPTSRVYKVSDTDSVGLLATGKSSDGQYIGWRAKLESKRYEMDWATYVPVEYADSSIDLRAAMSGIETADDSPNWLIALENRMADALARKTTNNQVVIIDSE